MPKNKCRQQFDGAKVQKNKHIAIFFNPKVSNQLVKQHEFV